MNLHPPQHPAGTVFRAGSSISTVLADQDFETYSEAGFYFDWHKLKWHGPHMAAQGKKGLPVVGAAVYATHPTTEVLSFKYDLKDGRGQRYWAPGLPNPQDLFDHIARGNLIEAWNTAFEWWIWNYCCVPKYGWPPLAIESTRCAMAKARAYSLPGALDDFGRVRNLQVQKDKAGKGLLKLLSMPRDPTKKDSRLRILPSEAPTEYAALVNYNGIDITTEAEASAHCPDLQGEELEFWLNDQRINRRGVHVDRESLAACVHVVDLCLKRYNDELHALTGGTVTAASQLPSLRAWLASQGVHIREGKGSMDDDALTELLKLNLPPLARRALEIRQLVGSASVKKVYAMANSVSQWDRLHDLFIYHGAHTGRPTGEGPQPTNLPKAGPPVWRCACGHYTGMHRMGCVWCGAMRPANTKKAEWEVEAVEDVLGCILRGDLALLEYCFGDAMLCVSGCLRGLFTAAPGHDLIASDFSAIESVVTACLAGEQWRIDMFESHGKNYEMAVSKISGIPFEDVMAHAGYTDLRKPEWWKEKQKGPHHPKRQTLGKVAELASGFGGWIPAWKRFGADEFMSDDEIKAAILAWRDTSPAIVYFWGGQTRRNGWQTVAERFGLEGMSIQAVENPGQVCPVLRQDGTHTGVTFTYDRAQDVLLCLLPSGRYLHYHRPRLDPSDRPYGGPLSLSYERWNTNPLQGATGWVRVNTYGGKWCENIVQAVARDLQRSAINALEREHYPVVLHVYDEDVVEVPHGAGSVDEVEAIMMRPQPWAHYRGKPWPIKAAGGWRGRRYRKA